MATFSCFNVNDRKVLELDYQCYSDNKIPKMRIDIRPMGVAGGGMAKSEAYTMVTINNFPSLIKNMENPNAVSVVQVGNGKTWNCLVGRVENNFTIQNGNVSGAINLNDNQWIDLIEYFKLMYTNGAMIRAICKNNRMHMINLLRQCGLDTMENGRYKTTPWYDSNYDPYENSRSNENGGGGYSSNGNNNYNPQQQYQPRPQTSYQPNNNMMPPAAPQQQYSLQPPISNLPPAPSMGMVGGTTMPNNMPPMPPQMGTMPPLNSNAMSDGMSSLLDSAF